MSWKGDKAKSDGTKSSRESDSQSSADITGGEEQTWSCEVSYCDWRSHHQADTTKKVDPQENDVRHYLVVTNNNLLEYLQCDRPSTLCSRHHDHHRCRHFCYSVTTA